MPEPLSSRDLAAFVAAVETGTVQGAAEVLDLTQSAATKRIQALERRLGVELLVRGRAGVRASAEGQALYSEARRALDALASAEQTVAMSRAAQPLKIAASHTVGEALLPAWLAEFRRSAPDVHPQVDVLNSPGVIATIRAQEAEVGFVEGLDSLTGLESKAVIRDEIVVAVGTGHRWARRRAIRPAELSGQPFVSRESRSGTRAVAEARLAEVGIRLEPDLSLASLEAVKRSLAAGGFTLISRLALEPETAAGLLVAVPIRDLKIERSLIAVRRHEDHRRRAGARFWDWLDQLR
ncbi:MAG: LysR family transcriptional regulator [Actinobacteria bacterium]|nr:LysR family transcriptional regulator [Actinomycetota bacterium]